MIAVLCLGLSGISVGSGYRGCPTSERPTRRRSRPASEARSTCWWAPVFIFAIVTALAVPCHLYFAGQEHPELVSIALSQQRLPAVALRGHHRQPDRGNPGQFRSRCGIGIKAFQRMEF